MAMWVYDSCILVNGYIGGYINRFFVIQVIDNSSFKGLAVAPNENPASADPALLRWWAALGFTRSGTFSFSLLPSVALSLVSGPCDFIGEPFLTVSRVFFKG